MPLFSRRRRAVDPSPPVVVPRAEAGARTLADTDRVDEPATVDPSAGAATVGPADLGGGPQVAVDSADEATAVDPSDQVDKVDEPDPDEPLGAPGTATPTGPVPRDASLAGPDEDHLDLGAVRLPTADDVLEGIEIQLQADPETNAVMALLLVDGPEKGLELRAFAAPRHESLWDEVRGEIAAEATGAGGLTQPVAGRWGEELLVQVAVTLPDGQDAVQVTRFVGVDGPRWFLRGAFLGRAAIEPDSAERLDAILAGVTVVRGNEPMAPRDPLPFAVPGQPGELPDLAADGGRPPLEPFERGPEITEIR